MDGGGDRQAVVIVGNGMMSHALCRRLVDCGATRGEVSVTVFGEEPRPAYDRVHLTELFAGRTEDDLTLAPAGWYADHGIDLHLGDPVVSLDRDECVARSASGVVAPYDRLIFATGSHPFVPTIPGAERDGVFVYRTVRDLRAIMAYATGAARAAVIGGGLLGLEAARAVRELGLEVHVVERSPGLLARQLDPAGAALLRARMEALGVRVHTGARTERIDHGWARGSLPPRILCFDDGERLAVDLVILAAGIRPRGDLGRAAGLAVTDAGGIVVDDHLRSSDARVFAVGECAAHRGTSYGLAAPGYRMVDVLVDNLAGGSATFEGADASARLKLLGVHVAALGRYDERETPGCSVHRYQAGDTYRKLVLGDGRIVGAVAVGEWDDLRRVEDAIAEPRRFSFWDMRRFRGTGSLWLRSESPPVHEWAPEAVVCGCLGVRRGALTDAERAGAASVEELSIRTGAGSLCGSCRPLLADYLGRQRAESLPSSRFPISIRPPSSLPSSLPLPLLQLPPPPPLPRLMERGEDMPATLRSEGPSEGGAADALDGPDSPTLRPPPPDSEPPSSTPWPRAAFDTLTSAAAIVLPVLDPEPRSAAEPSRPVHLDAPVPSSRRDSMRPLHPISVAPGLLPTLAPHPPSVARVPSVEERRRGALLGSAAAALAASVLMLVVPALPPARSFGGVHLDAVLSGRVCREATGYAVVALAVVGLVISVRKRTGRLGGVSVPTLRVVHGALGALALGCLAAHTGLHLGERLNRALVLDFLALSAVGAGAAAVTAGDAAAGQGRRLLWLRAHLVVLVPLPILVALHVLGAYYF